MTLIFLGGNTIIEISPRTITEYFYTVGSILSVIELCLLGGL